MVANSLSKTWLVLILAVSVSLRVAAAWYLGNAVVDFPGTFDQISYHNLAIRVLNGHGFTFGMEWWPQTPAGSPTAHWSFLYTLYLVVVYGLVGIQPLVARILQAAITGLLQPYLAFLIGEAVFSRAAGYVAAGLTAVYAYFVYYDAALMTEPFFITSVMAGLYLTLHIARHSATGQPDLSAGRAVRLSLALGLVLGAAVLLRQLILLFIPLIFLWLAWARRRRNLKLTLGIALGATLVIVLMVLPFSIYNTARFGHFVLLNTNAGYAFFWANHPIYGTQFQAILTSTRYQSLIPAELTGLDEAALDQALLRRGLEFILDDPLRYVRLSISRIPVFFMFWPSTESQLIANLSRVASFGVLWPFMIYGLYRAFANDEAPLGARLASPKALLAGFASAYTLIHLLSWALIRYRLPVDAVLITFAGVAIVDLFERIRSWRHQAVPAS